ncbi:MAG: hypothetical protein E5X69_22680, partial [Mesorhizobium sp.]
MPGRAAPAACRKQAVAQPSSSAYCAPFDGAQTRPSIPLESRAMAEFPKKAKVVIVGLGGIV